MKRTYLAASLAFIFAAAPALAEDLKACGLKVTFSGAPGTDSAEPADGNGLVALCQAAEAGNAEAARVLGERFADRDDPLHDLEKADELYAHAAALGDGRAAFLRGFLLSSARRGTEALASWQRAVDLGYDRAGFLIARGHARGEFGDLSEPRQGLALLEGYVEQDLRGAKFALATALASGPDVVLDAERATRLLTELAQAGEPKAYEMLGALYSKGRGTPRDRERAIGYYRKAAENGVDRAWLSLGKQYMAAGDGTRALETIQIAADRDVRGADREIVVGHYRDAFGDRSRPGIATALMVSLAEGGDFTAARTLALRPPGPGVADYDLVVANLESLASEGNPWAAEAAAQFLRTHPGWVTGAGDRRAAVLADHADLMRPEVRAREMVHVLYSGRDLRGSAGRVEALLDDMGEEARYSGIRETFKVSRNFYVAVVQNELKNDGFYTGRVDGYLTPRTIRALSAFCADQGIAEICRNGPLTSSGLSAVARAIARPDEALRPLPRPSGLWYQVKQRPKPRDERCVAPLCPAPQA